MGAREEKEKLCGRRKRKRQRKRKVNTGEEI
jgi:hypothetical protein